MNKKYLIILVIPLTIILSIIIYYNFGFRYSNLVLSSKKLDDIVNNREESDNLYLKYIKFNDYKLIIDEENKTIYYSIIDGINKYNPIIDYEEKDIINMAFNYKMGEDDKDYKVIIYDNNYYKIYNLVISDLPIINISSEEEDLSKKTDATISVFDNNRFASQKYVESLCTVKEKNEDYTFTLNIVSLGNNIRKNNISILGMDKHSEYVLRKSNEDSVRSVLLFINNKYKGVYTLTNKERRDVNETIKFE